MSLEMSRLAIFFKCKCQIRLHQSSICIRAATERHALCNARHTHDNLPEQLALLFSTDFYQHIYFEDWFDPVSNVYDGNKSGM